MIRNAHRAIGLCLSLILIAGLAPKPARAEDSSKDRSIQTRAAAAFGPIGTVYSLGGVSINGRSAHGEQMLWGGELLQVSDGASASVQLDSLGQVTLTREAIVKLASTTTNLDDNKKHSLLAASLASGDIVIKLEPDAGAYIETCGLAFTSSVGASFRIGIREGQAVIDMARGTVRMEPQPPVAIPRDVNARPNAPPIPISKTRLNTKPNKPTRGQIQWLIKNSGRTNDLTMSSTPRLMPVHNQTTQTETPITNRTVRFDVVDINNAPSNLGTFQSPTDTTDGLGVVSYTFQAGDKRGSGRIRARIDPDPSEDPPGTIYETYYRDFKINKFWTTRNKLLIAAAAVGGAVACVVFCSQKEKGPLRQVPPPTSP